MGITKKLNSIGVMVGIIFIGISIYNLVMNFVDPSSTYLRDQILFVTSYLIPGVLLLVPWSKTKSKPLYLILAVALTISIIFLCWVLYVTNTWASIHGAGLFGNSLLFLLIIFGVSQLLVLWSYYPKYDASA